MNVNLEFYDTEPEVDDIILAVIDHSTEMGMFIAVVDEDGELKFPDNGDDIGWRVDDVSIWADITEMYNLVGVFLDHTELRGHEGVVAETQSHSFP